MYKEQAIWNSIDAKSKLGVAQGWGRTRVWLHIFLHALFKRLVEGLDRVRLLR